MPSFRWRWITGVLISFLMASAGMALYPLYAPEPAEIVFTSDQGSNKLRILLLGILQGEPEQKTNSVAIAVRIFAMHDSTGIRCNPFMLAVWVKGDEGMSLKPGDTLCFTGMPRKITNPGNPGEFDYAAHMARKGIFYRMFQKEGEWGRVGQGCPNPFQGLLLRSRQAIRQKVYDGSLSGANQGLALALLLGIKDGLEEEVSRSFSVAGTIHVLCVSGLHAGIIFLVVNILLGGVRKIPRFGRPLFFVIALCSVWGYAFLTGLPPSVGRASLMLSFVLLGKLLNRNTPTINSVAGSALMQLAVNPALLSAIGFQLSYLAVVGIVTLFKPLSQLWNPAGKLWLKLRDLAGVSLCAQLFTFPVTLAAFHTFPTWFLLANIMVIPVTGFVIYAGMLFLIFPGGFLHHWSGVLFDNMLSLMRWMVRLVESMPHAEIRGIAFSPSQSWIIMGAVLALMLWLQNLGKRFLILFLSLIFIFLIYNTYYIGKRDHQQAMVVYNVTGNTLIDLIDNGLRTTVSGPDTVSLKSELFAASAHRIRNGVYRKNSVTNNFYMSPGTITVINHPAGSVCLVGAIPDDTVETIHCDVAIITGQVYPDIRLFSRIEAGVFVLDGSVKTWRVMEWENLAQQSGTKCWSTASKGAYVATRFSRH